MTTTASGAVAPTGVDTAGAPYIEADRVRKIYNPGPRAVEALSEGMWTTVTLGDTVSLVERCGFVVDAAIDRQPWYAEMVVAERDRFDSEWGERFVEQFGQASFDNLRSEWVDFAAAAQGGALSPGHLRATKPDKAV